MVDEGVMANRPQLSLDRVIYTLITMRDLGGAPIHGIFNRKEGIPPEVVIGDFEGIMEDDHAMYSDVCMMLALGYVRRISATHNITNANIQSIFYTAFHVAAKFVRDDYFDVKLMAHLLKIKVGRMRTMEMEFLKLVDYRIYDMEWMDDTLY